MTLIALSSIPRRLTWQRLVSILSTRQLHFTVVIFDFSYPYSHLSSFAA